MLLLGGGGGGGGRAYFVSIPANRIDTSSVPLGMIQHGGWMETLETVEVTRTVDPWLSLANWAEWPVSLSLSLSLSLSFSFSFFHSLSLSLSLFPPRTLSLVNGRPLKRRVHSAAIDDERRLPRRNDPNHKCAPRLAERSHKRSKEKSQVFRDPIRSSATGSYYGN